MKELLKKHKDDLTETRKKLFGVSEEAYRLVGQAIARLIDAENALEHAKA